MAWSFVSLSHLDDGCSAVQLCIKVHAARVCLNLPGGGRGACLLHLQRL
jgi:hypothetical protein